MVIDTSALLALAFREPFAEWVTVQLDRARADLHMSSVNYAEYLIRLRSRQPVKFAAIREQTLRLPIQISAPDERDAEVAAEARILFPLNLGDCFAYALAKRLNMPILTLDSDFLKTDIVVVSPPRH
ncbi:MAG: type II toxin-antitoxin system VapC family toxin [Acidobacteria bacterium]|nr:type II toxin-antitoxin system VapC family toxin [Acidobacteriota bacterium]